MSIYLLQRQRQLFDGSDTGSDRISTTESDVLERCHVEPLARENGLASQSDRVWQVAVASPLHLWGESVLGVQPDHHLVKFEVPLFRAYAEGATSVGSCCFFPTKAGLVGMAPTGLRAGDNLVIVPSQKPFVILRSHKEFYSFQ